ncbi:hypothetical protein WJ968_02390 [Achromobacter xylosoxidans]
MTFQELVDAARPKARKATTDDQLREQILHHLVLMLNANALQYRLEPVGYGGDDAKPKWIPGLARLHALATETALQVGPYNLWHQQTRLPSDDVYRFVIGHIDQGTSVADIRTRLRDALASGELSHPNGKSLKRVRNLDPVAQTILSDVLGRLRIQGLLV